MAQDLLGLTIHIFSIDGFVSEDSDVKSVFWEAGQISEQFELIVLNTSHRVVHEHLSSSELLVQTDQIRVEVVGKYDPDSPEEWFAIGVGFTDPRHKQIIESISRDARFPELLCLTLEFEIIQMLARDTSVQHVGVEAEVTSYASMWG